MKYFKILYILFFFNIYFFLCQTILTTNNINNEDISIQNAVYIIRNKEGDKNLDFENDGYPIFLNEKKKLLKNNFLLIKENNNEENINNTNNYYYIQDNISNNKIGITNQNLIKRLNVVVNKDILLWNIIPKINLENKLVYYVQNKNNKKFWEYNPNNVNQIILSQTTDINNLTINNEFQFIKMYRKSDKIETQKLKDEPIDILIKYIDLSDPNLIRKGIPQIKKDHDNKELKFSVRSILQNIPWIRKIFILMPNEKVSFFKSPEEIKEKIEYIKDKDLLGFDSASSPSFQFNLHKMKKFGISENFILMDDDCFIGKPLKKSDFFYEENGTIYPSLITSDYYEMDKIVWNQRLKLFLSKPDKKNPHTTLSFHIQHARSLLLMYDIFGEDNKRYGKKLIEPAYTHNAIPVKLSDIEEIHDYILKYYPFANDTLNALYRSPYSLQMQTTYMAYVKNQYDRKVSIISSAFYDLINYKNITKNEKELFVINTGTKNYKNFLYTYERKNLNILFPNKTKYELDNDFDSELKDLKDIENILYKSLFIDINEKKEKKDYKNINKSLIYINNQIKNVNDIIKELKNKNITIIDERKYTQLLKDEINYLNNECNKLTNVNYYLLYFYIIFVFIKLFCYLIEIKKKNIETMDNMDIVI